VVNPGLSKLGSLVMQMYLQWISEIARDNKKISASEMWHMLCQRYLASVSHSVTLFASPCDCLSFAKHFATDSSTTLLTMASDFTNSDLVEVISSIESKGAFAQLLQIFLTCFPQSMVNIPNTLTEKLSIKPYVLPLLTPPSTPVSVTHLIVTSDEKTEEDEKDSDTEEKSISSPIDFAGVLQILKGSHSTAMGYLKQHAKELVQYHCMKLMDWAFEKSVINTSLATETLITLYKHGSSEELTLLTQKLLDNLKVQRTKVNNQVIGILKNVAAFNPMSIAVALPKLLEIVETVKFDRNDNTPRQINEILAQLIKVLDDDQLYRWINTSVDCFAEIHEKQEQFAARNYAPERYLPVVKTALAKENRRNDARHLMALMIKQGNAHKELLPFVLEGLKAPETWTEFYTELVDIICEAQSELDCQPIIEALVIAFDNQKEDDGVMIEEEAIASIANSFIIIGNKPAVNIQLILQPLLDLTHKKQSHTNQKLIDIMRQILFPEDFWDDIKIEHLQKKLAPIYLEILEKLFVILDDDCSDNLFNSLNLFRSFAHKWPDTSIEITTKLIPFLGLQKPYSPEKLSFISYLCEAFEKLPEIGQENAIAICAEITSILRKLQKNEKLDPVLLSLLFLLSHLATQQTIDSKLVFELANKIQTLAFASAKFVKPLAMVYARLIALQHEGSDALLTKQVEALSSQDEVLRHTGEGVLKNLAAHKQIGVSAYLPHYVCLLTSTDAYSRVMAIQSLPELVQRTDVNFIEALTHLYSATKDANREVHEAALAALAGILTSSQFSTSTIVSIQANAEEKIIDLPADQKDENSPQPPKRLKLTTAIDSNVSVLISDIFNLLIRKLSSSDNESLLAIMIKALLVLAKKNLYFWETFCNKLSEEFTKRNYIQPLFIKCMRKIADESTESITTILNLSINILTADSNSETELISQNIIELITQKLDPDEQNHYLYGVLLIKLSAVANSQKQGVIRQTIEKICLYKAEQFQAENPISSPINTSAKVLPMSA
jgi:hypothetical protein